MAALIKTNEMNRRRQRRAKLSRLREKFAKAKNEDEKSILMGRVNKIAPWLSLKEFTAPILAK